MDRLRQLIKVFENTPKKGMLYELLAFFVLKRRYKVVIPEKTFDYYLPMLKAYVEVKHGNSEFSINQAKEILKGTKVFLLTNKPKEKYVSKKLWEEEYEGFRFILYELDLEDIKKAYAPLIEAYERWRKYNAEKDLEYLIEK